MRRATLAMAMAMAMAACGTGNGAEGVGVAVRHEQRGQLTEPVAVGAKLPLGLHNGVRTSLIGGYQYVAGTIEVKDSSDNAVPTTEIGTGEFDTVLPAAGRYSVTGKTDKGETTVIVTARDVASLDVGGLWVTTQAAGGSCTKSVAPGPLTLSVNQYVELTVGARSAEGEALLGLLAVDVLDLGVTVNRPLLSTGGNSYVITPKGQGGISATFTDRMSGASVKLSIEHDSAAMATCP